jgi:hypothetical protein
MLADPDNRIGELLRAGKSDGEMIEELYLTAFARRPTTDESKTLSAFVAEAKDRRAGIEDMVWGLVNSKEFLLRR